MNNNRCSCKYNNPIELVCTARESRQRMLCKACAWDFPDKNNIKTLKEWESLITNDCVFQRMQNVASYSELHEALDQIMQITKFQLCKMIEKRCLALKDTLKKQASPIKQVVEAFNNVSNKKYNTDTVQFLVGEIDFSDFQNELNELEAITYQSNKLVCKQIVDMANLVQKLINSCNQQQKVGELGSISKSIQQKLDYKIKSNKYQAYKLNMIEKDDALYHQKSRYQVEEREFNLFTRSNLVVGEKDLKYVGQQAQQAVTNNFRSYQINTNLNQIQTIRNKNKND